MVRILNRSCIELVCLLVLAYPVFPLCADQQDEAEEPAVQSVNEAYVGWLELSGPLPDGQARYAWVTPDQEGATLRRVVKSLGRVARNESYAGVVIYLDEVMLNLSQVQEITEAINEVRAAGRKVLVFAEQYDLLTYLLACSADRIVLQRKGLIELTGLGVEEMYLAGLLKKVGLQADFLQVGRFKGAQDPLTRDTPSEAWSETMDRLLDDLYAWIVSRIAEDRGLGHEQVERIMTDCWTMTDEQYIERGVVDQLAGRDLIEATGEVFGNSFVWDDLLETTGPRQEMENPFAVFRMLFQEPQVRVRRPSLAMIHVKGPIVMGESQTDGTFGSSTVGSKTMVDALVEARDNSKIKGVVLRIDSPGGSALASELIWQAVRDLGETKPVFVSVGAMAASGGYYIACAGQSIYASPGSLLGSIGVVGGKIILGGLYEKIGVNVHRRSRGPLGDMFNSVEPFTDPQRAALQNAFDRIYEQFTDRVAVGRGRRVSNMDAVAQGRVFTGRQAVGNGLADKIGGVETVLANLAEQVGFEPGEYDVVNLPQPKSLAEVLEELFQMPGVRAPGMGVSQLIGTARAVLGERRWRAAAPVLTGLMRIQQEPILTLMPTAIVIK